MCDRVCMHSYSRTLLLFTQFLFYYYYYYYSVIVVYHSKQNMVKTVSQMPPQPGSGPQHIVEDICPNGVWSVTVWAINEYNGIGSAANNIQVTINDTACDRE